MRFCLKIALAALFGGIAVTSAVLADTYPSKPVKLIVGFPPGGPTDIIGRVIGDALSKELGQPVVIENNGGAGGVIAAGNVARAKPDGYTLLVGVESSQTRAAALNSSLAYDQQKSFTYLRKLAKQQSLLVVNPKVTAKTLKELIDYAKAHPGELNTGGTFATSSHIGGTLFDASNGTRLTFINYPGGSQPITDTIGGVLQVGFFTEATVAAHVKSGSLRALAILAPARSVAFPDLPTIAEAGAPAIDPSPWFGVIGPANLPPAIAKSIGDALDRVAASPAFADRLASIGALPIAGSTAAGFTSEIGQEIAFWDKWAKDVKAPLVR